MRWITGGLSFTLLFTFSMVAIQNDRSRSKLMLAKNFR